MLTTFRLSKLFFRKLATVIGRRYKISMPVYVVTGSDEGSDEFIHEFVDGAADHVEHAFEIVARAVNGLRTIGFFGGAKIIR